MNDRIAWLLVVIGALLVAAGCRPLPPAVGDASSAMANALKDAHDEIAERYRRDQLEAAAAVEGDRGEVTVRAEQQHAVNTVRERWRKAFESKGIPWDTWTAAGEIDAEVDALIQEGGA